VSCLGIPRIVFTEEFQAEVASIKPFQKKCQDLSVKAQLANQQITSASRDPIIGLALATARLPPRI
jgi:hypothetical protein